MLYMLVALALSSAGASRRSPPPPPHRPPEGCATHDAKVCYESKPVSGYNNPGDHQSIGVDMKSGDWFNYDHLMLHAGHVEDRRRHVESYQVDSEEEDNAPGRARRLSAEVDEEKIDKSIFEKVCDVADMPTAGWYHFSTTETGEIVVAKKDAKAVKAPQPVKATLFFQNLFVDNRRSQLALWGPYDDLADLQKECGWDHDDKLLTCTSEFIDPKTGEYIADMEKLRELKDYYGKTPLANFKLSPGIGSNPQSKSRIDIDPVILPNKHYAIMVGTTYEAEEAPISLRFRAKLYTQKFHIEQTHGRDGCVWCDHFWDGASHESIGQPVCAKEMALEDFHQGVPGRFPKEMTIYPQLKSDTPFDGLNSKAPHQIHKDHYVFVEEKATEYSIEKNGYKPDAKMSVPNQPRPQGRSLTTREEREEQEEVRLYPGDEGYERRVVECRPAKLPESLASDPFGPKSPVKNVMELDHVLKSVGAAACPKDHTLALADHWEAPIPPCECEVFPEAKGSWEWLMSRLGTGTTMCMKFVHQTIQEGGVQGEYTYKHPSTQKLHTAKEYEFETQCFEPHPEYPAIGIEDGGRLTEEGCRSDMIPCRLLHLGKRPGGINDFAGFDPKQVYPK